MYQELTLPIPDVKDNELETENITETKEISTQTEIINNVKKVVKSNTTKPVKTKVSKK